MRACKHGYKDGIHKTGGRSCDAPEAKPQRPAQDRNLAQDDAEVERLRAQLLKTQGDLDQARGFIEGMKEGAEVLKAQLQAAEVRNKMLSEFYDNAVASLRKSGDSQHSPYLHRCIDIMAEERDDLRKQLAEQEELVKGLCEQHDDDQKELAEAKRETFEATRDVCRGVVLKELKTKRPRSWWVGRLTTVSAAIGNITLDDIASKEPT